MRLAALALAALVSVSCGAGGPTVPSLALPSVELPSFDTASIEQLVDDALAEVDRVASNPPELPPDLQRLLDENDIQLPSLPSNATQICDALGIPGVGSLASAGLSSLISELVVGGELGLVVGLLSVVIVRTCPVWMPHLETAVEELL
jgi:hypothetical protein